MKTQPYPRSPPNHNHTPLPIRSLPWHVPCPVQDLSWFCCCDNRQTGAPRSCLDVLMVALSDVWQLTRVPSQLVAIYTSSTWLNGRPPPPIRGLVSRQCVATEGRKGCVMFFCESTLFWNTGLDGVSRKRCWATTVVTTERESVQN